VRLLLVRHGVTYYNTEARYTRIVCSSSIYYFTLSSYALRWPLLPILMEQRDSSLFPTLLSPFPSSSFRLRSTCSTQLLANVTLYGEHLGCCWGAHPLWQQQVEQLLGWLMRGRADADSLRSKKTQHILTMPESSVYRAPTTPSHEGKCACRIFLRSGCLFPLPHHLPVSAHDLHALAEC